MRKVDEFLCEKALLRLRKKEAGIQCTRSSMCAIFRFLRRNAFSLKQSFQVRRSSGWFSFLQLSALRTRMNQEQFKRTQGADRTGPNEVWGAHCPNDCHPVLCKVLQHTIDIHAINPPRIRQVKPLTHARRVSDEEAFWCDRIEADWKDKELLSGQKWEFSNFSCKTPPMTSLSPYQQKALNNQAEIEQCR